MASGFVQLISKAHRYSKEDLYGAQKLIRNPELTHSTIREKRKETNFGVIPGDYLNASV